MIVRMHIETPTGDREVVERTLENFGLTISGQASADDLFSNRVHILALEQKLEMAKLEVRHTYQVLALTESTYADRIRYLEDDVQYLRQQLGVQIAQTDAQRLLTGRSIEVTEQVLSAQAGLTSLLVSDLMSEAKGNDAVLDALRSIEAALTSDVPQDPATLTAAARTIQREAPGLVADLMTALTNVTYGVTGNQVFQILQRMLS